MSPGFASFTDGLSNTILVVQAGPDTADIWTKPGGLDFDPKNPIKARWMGFFDGAGIHGTDAKNSLGSAASHGCVRMAIPDVIELFDRVDVGTPIHVS